MKQLAGGWNEKELLFLAHEKKTRIVVACLLPVVWVKLRCNRDISCAIVSFDHNLPIGPLILYTYRKKAILFVDRVSEEARSMQTVMGSIWEAGT